jgi:beta-glucosidase
MSEPALVREEPAFRDPDLPLDVRLDDLLGRLTRSEKVALMHQHQPAVPRLGIAAAHTGREALHGVAWLGRATVFPQAVGLASTWSPELVRRVGAAVGEEVRGFHHRDPASGLNVWAPVVNLLRDPRWGRNEEGYSEDPLLTGAMATAFAGGLRGDHPVYLKTAPTLKHFLAYNCETDRSTVSVSVRPRVLWEYELPAFQPALAAGVATGVMPSYNLVNGRPAHLSPLLDEVVRPWSRDELLVVSDAFAPSNVAGEQGYYPGQPEAHAALVAAGVDSFTDQGTDPGLTIASLESALDDGLLTVADVDRAVRRVLAIRFRLGEFDPPGRCPYACITEAAIDTPAHRALAREAARAAIVLLGNDGGLLPLPRSAGRVAVLGPLADILLEDWYGGTLPYQVTPVDGIRQALGPGAAVTCHEGVDRIALRDVATGCRVTAPAGAGGPLALRAASGAAAQAFDVFDWGDGVCTLRSAANGRLVRLDDGDRPVNDSVQPRGWVVREAFRLVARGEGTVLLRSAATGRYVTVTPAGELVASADAPGRATRFAREVLVDGVAAAVEAAREADVAVVVCGNAPCINGRETEDRTDLRLPHRQRRLVRSVLAANERTVLVLESGYPFAVGWEQERVPAILWTSHGGQELGHALADVLFGDHAPAGRLTQTWYRSVDDLGDIRDYDVIGGRRTYLYFEGSPLYPFGHGLTYAEFRYEDLRLSRHAVGEGGAVVVSATVTNAGPGDGDEVVQLYTRKRASRVDQPRLRLRGFERVPFEAGETRTVRFDLRAADLAVWDVTRGRYAVEGGVYDVLVGRSSADLRLCTVLEVDGETIGRRDPAGRAIAAADFDDSWRVALVDETRSSGDAVMAAGGSGWIAFRDVDFGAGLERFTVRVAKQGPGAAGVELRLDGPAAGRRVGSVDVPCTGGRYEWTEVTTPLRGACGVHDLYLVLTGGARVSRFRFG